MNFSILIKVVGFETGQYINCWELNLVQINFVSDKNCHLYNMSLKECAISNFVSFFYPSRLDNCPKEKNEIKNSFAQLLTSFHGNFPKILSEIFVRKSQ